MGQSEFIGDRERIPRPGRCLRARRSCVRGNKPDGGGRRYQADDTKITSQDHVPRSRPKITPKDQVPNPTPPSRPRPAQGSPVSALPSPDAAAAARGGALRLEPPAHGSARQQPAVRGRRQSRAPRCGSRLRHLLRGAAPSQPQKPAVRVRLHHTRRRRAVASEIEPHLPGSYRRIHTRVGTTRIRVMPSPHVQGRSRRHEQRSRSCDSYLVAAVLAAWPNPSLAADYSGLGVSGAISESFARRWKRGSAARSAYGGRRRARAASFRHRRR